MAPGDVALLSSRPNLSVHVCFSVSVQRRFHGNLGEVLCKLGAIIKCARVREFMAERVAIAPLDDKRDICFF